MPLSSPALCPRCGADREPARCAACGDVGEPLWEQTTPSPSPRRAALGQALTFLPVALLLSAIPVMLLVANGLDASTPEWLCLGFWTVPAVVAFWMFARSVSEARGPHASTRWRGHNADGTAEASVVVQDGLVSASGSFLETHSAYEVDDAWAELQWHRSLLDPLRHLADVEAVGFGGGYTEEDVAAMALEDVVLGMSALARGTASLHPASRHRWLRQGDEVTRPPSTSDRAVFVDSPDGTSGPHPLVVLWDDGWVSPSDHTRVPTADALLELFEDGLALDLLDERLEVAIEVAS